MLRKSVDWFPYDNSVRHERLKLSSGANQKKKEKDVGKEIIKKRIEQRVYHNSLQEMRVNDRESHFMLFV